MAVYICLLACWLLECATTTSASNEHSLKQEGNTLFEGLLLRIDQLEEKLQARDLKHIEDIETLRQNHKSEIAKLRTEHDMDLASLRVELEEQIHRIVSRDDNRIVSRDDNHIVSRENTAQVPGHDSEDTSSFLTGSSSNGAGSYLDVADMQRKRSGHLINTSDPDKVSDTDRSAARRGVQTPDVAFTAVLSSNLYHIGSNQPIPFDQVVTNVGNTYNNHTGVFVAPVAGTYVFSVTLMTHGQDTGHYGIFKNVDRVTLIYLTGDEKRYDTDSQTITLHLAQGDDVSIRHTESDHTLEGFAQCTFSGFLLFQDSPDAPVLVGK